MTVCLQRRSLLLATVGLLFTVAQAQGRRFPAREVQLVVPSEAGGGIDAVARIVARGLSSIWSHPAVVINRSGASGNVGTASVARADADGHTLLVTGVAHLVSPMLHAEPGYHPLKDFTPLVRVGTAPSVLMVHESLRGLTLQQIVDGPGRSARLAYASAGYGHSSHLAAEIFLAHAKVQALHVPYKGTNPALRALMAGEVQFMFVPASSAAAAAAGGRAVALAVAQAERLAGLPAVPTLAEAGFPDAEFAQWYGLFAPSAVPAPLVDEIVQALQSTLADPLVRGALTEHGVVPGLLSRAEFSRFITVEQQRLAEVVRRERVRGAGN